MTTVPTRALESFPNPEPGRDYEIRFECPEFTCLCPKTGQPDFATVRIRYTPDKLCVELKSLKLYLWSFRGEGAFHEAVTNRILGDLVALLAPRRMSVVGDFLVRGGIHTVVEARHPGWESYPGT
ncbi:MAG: NADPH-dependent 7-cyano-7-deazaguanine reductase QueF [Planctomycetes bacterium]|nr:NADPH-dependent 7-cyano-7-deazaguanine reductase QueF [Planctomycetota bacterium]